MTEEVLYDNGHYEVKIGDSIHNPEKFPCYQVWNKKYNIIETETTVLPIARQNADEFAKELSRMLEEDVEGEDKKILTLQ